MSIPVIDCDLAIAPVDLIVQQCNCLTTRVHGLSEHLKKHLGADPYKRRPVSDRRRNLAIKEDRAIPGSVKIFARKHTTPKYLACLYAQFTPGRPNGYYQDVCKEHGLSDSKANREEWFKMCLVKLVEHVKRLGCKKVAFPYGIACGFGGGDWKVYNKIISDWAIENKDSFEVVYCKL